MLRTTMEGKRVEIQANNCREKKRSDEGDKEMASEKRAKR